jgi:CBS domain containing-hemolysin-like protein
MIFLYSFLLVLLIGLSHLLIGLGIALTELNNSEEEQIQNKLLLRLLKHEKETKDTLLLLQVTFLFLGFFLFYLFWTSIPGLSLPPVAIFALVGGLTSIIGGLLYLLPSQPASASPKKYLLAFYWLLIPGYFLFYPLTSAWSAVRKRLTQSHRFVDNDDLSEADIIDVIEDAVLDGTISNTEEKILKKAIDFDACLVTEVMVPRVKIIGISTESSVEQIKKVYRQTGYSRLPVYQNSLDEIVGVLNFKNFINDCVLGKKPVSKVWRPCVTISAYMNLGETLKLIQKNKSHLVIIKDEFDGTIGLITMEDIIEQLVGEIYDEHDQVIETITPQGPDTFLVRGDCDLDQLQEYFDLEPQAEDEPMTLNGLLLALFGYIPVNGEEISDASFHYVIEKASATQIELVRLTFLGNKGKEEEKEETK